MLHEAKNSPTRAIATAKPQVAAAQPEFEVTEYSELVARYGVLPADHPVSIFVEQRTQKLHPGLSADEMPRSVVLGSRGEGVNAMAFSNGMMVFTPELIGILQHIEELDAVILHESQHILGKHFAKASESKNEAELISHLRLHEYESDSAAFVKLGDPIRESNPRGALSLLERLRSLDHQSSRSGKGEGWDVSHGRTSDRIAVLRSLLQNIELGSSANPLKDQINKPLTVLPPEISEQCRSIPYSKYDNCFRHRLLPGDANFGVWLDQFRKIASEIKTLSELELVVSQINRCEADAGSTRTRLAQHLRGISAPLAEVWCGRIQRLLKAEGIESEHQLIIATAALARERLGSDLFSGKVLPTGFSQELKQKLCPGNKGALLIQPDDLKVLRELVDIPKFKITDKHSYLKELTQTLLDHQIFDLEDGDGINHTQFAKWIEDCVETETSPAFRAHFLQEALLLGIKAHDDLGGSSRESRCAWAAVIREFGQKDPACKSGLASLLRKDTPKLLLKKESSAPSTTFRSFLESVLQQALGAENTPEQLTDISKLTRDFLSGVEQGASEEQLKLTATRLIRAIADLPEVCKIDTGEDLGIFTGFDRKMQTRVGCAQVVVEYLDDLRELDEQIVADLILGICQVASRNNLEYDELLTSLLNGSTQLQYIVGNSDTPSPLVPQDLLGLVKDLREPDTLRVMSSGYGIDEAWELLSKLPATKENLALVTGRYLNTWETPLEDKEAELQKIVQHGLKILKEEPPTAENRELLYDLAYFLPDISLRRQVQGTLLPELLADKSPKEAIDFIFNRYPLQLKYGLNLKILSDLDQSLRTAEDFEVAQRKMHQIWSSMTKANSGAASMIAADGLSHALSRLDRSDLLTAILTSQYGDDELRKLVFEAWQVMNHDAFNQLIDDVIDADSKADMEQALENYSQSLTFRYEDQEISNRIAKSPDLWLQGLYALDTFERMALLRDCISGEGGILNQKNGRKKIVDILFKNLLTESEDADLINSLREATEAFVHCASIDELTELLVATLSDQVLVPPTTKTSWEPCIANFMQRCISYVDFPGKVIERAVFTPKEQARSETTNKQRQAIVQYMAPIIGQALTQTAESDLSSIRNSLSELNALDTANRSHKPLSALDFITQIGSRLDAPGVRTLQLVGQLMPELPQAVRERLLSLYDARQGQSALTAWQTLEKISPQFRSQLNTLGPTLGGGSIYTVFLGDIKSGAQEALRIMNPNALDHTKQRMALLERTVDKLVDSDSAYAKVRPILQLVDQWIRQELSDQDFFKLDAGFRNSWQNWSPEWAKKHGISVLIPESRSVPGLDSEGGIKVMRDEFIPGVTNFTNATELSPQTFKHMAALGTQFYMAQIIGKNPFGESIILSDISKGNAGITADHKQLAVFDRGMYLTLGLMEKLKLKTIVEAKSGEQVTKALIELLSSFPENQKFGAQGLKEKIDNFPEKHGKQSDSEALVFEGLSELFCEGVHIPLKWNLLLKNINAWRQIALEAGFGSLQEAITYKGE